MAWTRSCLLLTLSLFFKTVAAQDASKVQIYGQACDQASDGYLDNSPGQVDSFAVCAELCEASSQCQSVTFFASKWCSHFSTNCANLGESTGALSWITSQGWILVAYGQRCGHGGFLASSSGIQESLSQCRASCDLAPECSSVTFFASKYCSHFSTTCENTNAAAKAVSMAKRTLKQTKCDVSAGEVYLGPSSGLVANLAACKKSCGDASSCQSITFYQSGYCSHFSTKCLKRKHADNAISISLKNGVCTTSTACTATTTAVTTTTTTSETKCDPSKTNLLDHEVWVREKGYWVGEYTLLGADGDPKIGDSTTRPWPYPYDHYAGFIHIDIQGNTLTQNNVFLYPPQDPKKCNPATTTSASKVDVIGNGKCGVNGNEKIFDAQQQASDCSGNLAGLYPYGNFKVPTTTTIFCDDTVLYQVRYPEAFGLGLVQSQITSLPRRGARVRTAQLFGLEKDSLPKFVPQSSGVSYYRERMVTKEEWIRLLKEKRKEYNIRQEDHCSVLGSAQKLDQYPSKTTCKEHFGFEI